MSERDRQDEHFGTRLSEIDRKLRDIQADLGATEDGSPADADAIEAPNASPESPESPASPRIPKSPASSKRPGSPFASGGRSGPLEGVLLRAPRTAPPPAGGTLALRIGELVELQADLLDSLRDVLSAFERAVGQVATPPPPPAAPPPPRRRRTN